MLINPKLRLAAVKPNKSANSATPANTAAPESAAPTESFQAGLKTEATFKSETSTPTTKTVDLSGTIDESNWAPKQLKALFAKDIKDVFNFAYSVPPAVSVYGTSRALPQGSHTEDVSHWLGYQLAEKGIPVQTGGGDGVMSSVLEAYQQRRDELYPNKPEHLRTQAINIKLPWEQELNPFVDDSHEVSSSIGLLYRELGIYLNSTATGVLTGGIGTANELFDLWSRKLNGQHDDPVAIDMTFWGGLLETTKESMQERGLIKPSEWNVIDKSYDRAESLKAIDTVSDSGEREEVDHRLIAQISGVVDTLTEASAPMVTFLGSERLSSSDPTVKVAEKMATALTNEGTPLKLGNSGPSARAIVNAAKRADQEAEIQSYILDREFVNSGGLDTKGEVVSDPTTKQMALALRSEAVVALPGDVDTIADILSILVLSYVNAIPKQNIVLVGKDYWGPIVSQLKETVLNEKFPTASAGVLDRVTLTDDPQVALAAIKKKEKTN